MHTACVKYYSQKRRQLSTFSFTTNRPNFRYRPVSDAKVDGVNGIGSFRLAHAFSVSAYHFVRPVTIQITLWFTLGTSDVITAESIRALL